MIASSSPALRSSPLITPSYHVKGATVSPDTSSNTEASMSPIDTQTHSPVAMETRNYPLQSSPVVNGNCESILQPAKIQNNSNIPSTTTPSNSMTGIVQTRSDQYIPSTPHLTASYLPPQYSSVIQERMKNGNLLEEQIQQPMSYQPLQVVTSGTALVNTENLQQVINISPQMPFLSNATTHNTQAMVRASNGVVTQNGIATTTQAFMTSPEQNFLPQELSTSRTFYVQMENGSYQAVPFQSDMTSTNAALATGQLTNISTMSQTYVGTNSVETWQEKNAVDRDSIKEKLKTGPYRTMCLRKKC